MGQQRTERRELSDAMKIALWASSISFTAAASPFFSAASFFLRYAFSMRWLSAPAGTPSTYTRVAYFALHFEPQDSVGL